MSKPTSSIAYPISICLYNYIDMSSGAKMAIALHAVDLFADTLHLSFAEAGTGRSFLLLHGGAGPASMYGLAEALSAKARTVVPTHPGFNGAPRPERFGRIDDLVLAYLSLIERLDLQDVVLVGNSVDRGRDGAAPVAKDRRCGLDQFGRDRRREAGTVDRRSHRCAAGGAFRPCIPRSAKIRLRGVDAGSRGRDGGQPEGLANLRRRALHARADAALAPGEDADPDAGHLGRKRPHRPPRLWPPPGFQHSPITLCAGGRGRPFSADRAVGGSRAPDQRLRRRPLKKAGREEARPYHYPESSLRRSGYQLDAV